MLQGGLLRRMILLRIWSEMMELKKLTLQDGEHIRIGMDLELSIRITRHGDKLKIVGPHNSEATTAILTRSGLKMTREI